MLGYDRITIAGAEELVSESEGPCLDAGAAQVPVTVPGETTISGSEWRLQAKLLERGSLPQGWEENADNWRAFLDAASVTGPLALRTRMPGDRFDPLGMGGKRARVADFFTNQKVPREERDRIPLLVDGQGILWVCGQRIAHRARVRARSSQILLLAWRR
jgi:tRNA(Ile)-lysidine synthase